MKSPELSQHAAPRNGGDAFDKRLDVSDVRTSDALMRQSQHFRVNQDLNLQPNRSRFFPYYIQAYSEGSER